MGKMNKKDTAEYISRESQEMAMSGQYENWYAIEFALRDRGYSAARQQLDSVGTRAYLDQLCEIGKLARSRSITYDQALQIRNAELEAERRRKS